jgi:hypothetical protein
MKYYAHINDFSSGWQRILGTPGIIGFSNQKMGSPPKSVTIRKISYANTKNIDHTEFARITKEQETIIFKS